MYRIQNGILHKDGKKTFVLGESYYPSFHPCKFPVKPEDDRMGEMVKDLKMMAQAGFNHVRFAALGDLTYHKDSHTVTIDAPLVDAMTEEAGKNDLSVSVRLQGFSVNLRGFTDGEMIDENGHTPNYAWSDFVRSTVHHPGILEDNFIHGRDLAKHFAQYDNVVAYQIYNEPKYPQPKEITCDYNPHAIRAFRRWLVEKNVLTEAEAKDYQPPHGRKDQSPRMWALWRMFALESMTNFLNNASQGTKAGANLPTFTCLTADPACKTNIRRCVDVFGNAKEMDIVGYTIYIHAMGADYYPMCLNADFFQCAAEAEGKEAWCIELDSRTYIPQSVYNKGTYATVGAGVKGIVFYQWRGDCPVPGVPHPNSCGILNFDGTKTANFDNAVNVNHYIASINDLLVNAHRPHEGIGLLYSPYSNALNDALENSDYKPGNESFYNTSLVYFHQLYTDLRDAGYTVTITDAAHLEENRSGIRALVVPDMQSLSDEEKTILKRFWKAGGMILANNQPGFPTKAYIGLSVYDEVERTYEERVFLPRYTANDLPEITGIQPIAKSLEAPVAVQVLQGDSYTLLVLTNTSPVRKTVDARIRVSIPFETAEFTAIDGARDIMVNGNELLIKDITDGGIVVLR